MAARTGLTGRRVQTSVIALVLLVSTAAATLALGLLVDSNAPFDHAFAAQRGAHVTAAVNAARASGARLAATTRLPGVTAASGPFPQVTVAADMTFAAPPGPVDAGRKALGSGEPTGAGPVAPTGACEAAAVSTWARAAPKPPSRSRTSRR